MDFIFDEEQTAVQEAVDGIFAGMVTPDRVHQVEATDERFDRELWAELARADLLGLPVPEAPGGGGLGVGAGALMREGHGRSVAPLPLWATLVLGAMPIAEFGSVALVGSVLPGVAAGEVVLSAALADVAGDIAVGGRGDPSVTATDDTDGGGMVLSGSAFAVPFAHVADRVDRKSV